MNKVFKVIWSEARNAYVVVSEMAKSHGTKSCSTKKLLAMLIATGIMTCASVAPAMAANLAPNDTKIEVGKMLKLKELKVLLLVKAVKTVELVGLPLLAVMQRQLVVIV